MRLKNDLLFLCLLLGLLSAPAATQAKGAPGTQQIEVSLRMIGHKVLLSTGDSTSRVLPIEKEGDRYRISFDTEFEFDPEELVSTVNRVVLETGMGSGYILEVEECETRKVTYSYQIGDINNPDIIPCRTRGQPKASYCLLFTLLSPEADLESEAVVASPTFPSPYLVSALLIALLIGGAVLLRRKRSGPEANPNLLALGDYQFDERKGELLLDQQRIELSGKEADLLSLLYGSVNTTLEREVILQKVWGDEGSYVGRTLDVFISKLRKKLEADPKVMIVNVRGVGYKLVVDV